MLRVSIVLASTLAVVAIVSLAHAGVPEPGEAALTVRVIHDLNENEVWDEGEPGLEGWSADDLCGDVVSWGGTTDSAGEFTVILGGYYACVRFSVEFGWFALTPTRVIASYDPSEKFEAVLLVRQVGQDVARFWGRLIADGLPAPLDAELEAWVGGQRCGDMQVRRTLRATRYTLYVLPASELPGCAVEGGEVTFTVDGMEAAHSTFRPLETTSLDIVKGPSPMYFSYVYYSPIVGGPVTPRIGSRDCGSGFLITDFGPFPPNWQEVYVPAAETLDGCGSSDAVVSLRAGEQVVDQVLWEPGLVGQSSLRHLGDVDCDGEIASVDAAVVLQHAAGLLADIDCGGAADVDQSGVVDSIDAALLLQHAAELILWFPTE